MSEAEELEQKLLNVEPWVRELVGALYLHTKELEAKLDRAGAAEHQALRGTQELEDRVRAACDRNVIDVTWDDVKHPHVSRGSILTALACPSEPRRQGT